MFVATNRIRVESGTGDKLEERLKRRDHVKRQPGFHCIELWRLAAEPCQDFEEFLVVTHWESEENYLDWTKSDSYASAHSGPRAEYIVEKPEFKAYEIQLSTRVFRLFDKTIDLNM